MDNDKTAIVGFSISGENTNSESKFTKGTEDENDQTHSRWSKTKRLVVASVGVLTVTILLFVVLIIIYCLWTTRVLFQETSHHQAGDKNVDQELYQDSVDSLTIYHVHDGEIETWVILDNNRDLEIMKTNVGGTSTCYVSPANTDSMQEKNTTDPMQNAPKSEGENGTLPVVSRRPSSRPIKEKSVLGKKGQELCQGIDTFWVISSCNPQVSNSDGEGKISRVRRAVYNYYSCYWDWTRCYYVTYNDSPKYLYYMCDRTCGYRTYVY